MKTVVVWVLIVFSTGANTSPTMVVVDNIASQRNCEALAWTARDLPAFSVTTRCVAVRKVAP